LDQEIPDNLKELENLDITYCFALIKNVFRNEEQKIIKYCDNKFKLVDELRDIRNQKFAHMLLFETDDLIFSITVVKLEEIIRQLCANDQKVKEDFLSRIEEVLDMKNFSEKLVQFQESIINNNSINIQEFEILINAMKSNEKSRNILLEKIDSKVSKIDEKTDKIDIKTDNLGSEVSKIGSEVSKIGSEVSKIVSEVSKTNENYGL